jgi:hypothetical protein
MRQIRERIPPLGHTHESAYPEGFLSGSLLSLEEVWNPGSIGMTKKRELGLSVFSSINNPSVCQGDLTLTVYDSGKNMDSRSGISEKELGSMSQRRRVSGVRASGIAMAIKRRNSEGQKM